MKGWKECKLGDVLEIKYGKDHKLLPDGNIPVYGSGGIMRYVDKWIYNEESILIPRKGSLNNIFYMNEPFWTVDTIFWSKINNTKTFPKFLFYQLSVIDYANLNVGSAVPSLTVPVINAIDILLPPLPEQKAIAAVLSSFDDKIDLLHRQNKTLEAMAETLFRQWFVEEADEGWEEGKLGDIITVVSGTTPKTDKPEYWNGEYHWTSPRDITNLNGLFLFDTERKLTQLGLEQIGSGLLPVGSLLMSSRAPIGALAFAEIPVAINQGYAGIICDKGYSREFVYLWLKTNMDFVQSHGNGSTFQEISKSTFRELDINIPDNQTHQKFYSLVLPTFGKIRRNSVQIRTLEKLRDTLLPKLMSGEVRVKV